MMRTILFLSLLGLGVAAMMFCGCETEPANSPVHISPSSITIRPGQSIEFTATGGYDYEWSVTEPALGVLSVNTGPTTIYTSIYEGSGTNQQQTLRVVSTVIGSQSSTTNATSYSREATADIIHI